MTGGFDRLLTESEFDRFDQVLRSYEKNDLTPVSSVAPEGDATAFETLSVTRHQERVWLAQQQDPARVLRQAVAYRLGGIPDVTRLTKALDLAVVSVPELTMRYRFSEDGELQKYAAGTSDGTLGIVHVESRREAIDLILARQQTTWVSDTEAPFNALIIFCLDEVILALLFHRIVGEFCGPEDFLTNIAFAYDRMALQEPPRKEAAELELDPPRHAAIGWLRRQDQATQRTMLDFGNPARFATQKQRLAQRHGICLETVPLPMFQDGSTDELAALSFFGTRFARFLCRLGGHDRLEARFPVSPQDRLGDNCQGLAQKNVVNVPVSRDGDLKETDAEILAQLSASAKGVPLNVQNSGLPSVSIRWLTDPHRFFPAQTVTLQRLPLPTAEVQPDFSLAVGQDAEGHTLLELVTGQALSRYAGPLVLDLFAAELEAEQAGGEEPKGQLSQWAPFAGDTTMEEQDQTDELDNADDLAAIQSAILMEFRDALATPDLKADDDFFDFGGHSLVATRIIGRLLHNHGIEVRFNDLFGNPTAAALARHAHVIADAKKTVGNGSVEITTGQSDAAVTPLALAQMSLWKIYSAFGYSEIFNLPFALDFLDVVEEDVFEAAFRDLMERHEALRTLYVESENGEVLQKVVPASELESYKWFWRSGESKDTDRHTEAGYCFDLERELPVRLRFLTDPETGRQILSFLFHHLALDEWSVNLIMDELVEAYRARSAKEDPVFSGAPVPFHDFARKQVQAGVNSDHLGYWTDMLHDAPRELVLFSSNTATPEDVEANSAAGGWVEMRLAHETSEGLYALAKENSASLFNVVYAAISAALQKLGDLKDLVIGTSASGRTDADFFDTVGYFTTVVAHRVRFGAEPTVGGLIRDVKELINGSLPYTDIPIDLVETALGMTPGKDHLFDVFIQIHAQNKLNGNLPAPDGGRIAFRQVDPDKHDSHLALQFEVMEEVIDGERSIRVLMSYQAKRYSAAQVETIQETVSAMFEHFADDGASLKSLS